MQHQGVEALQWQVRQMTDQCLGQRIARLHRLVDRRFESELRPVGITLAQLELLSALSVSEGSARPRDIANRLGLERSTVSRNVAVLQQRGFVESTRTSTGRTSGISVSETGYAVLAETEEAWLRAHAWISEALGESAVATLDQWIKAVGARSLDHSDGS